jgi:hypothetical protein
MTCVRCGQSGPNSTSNNRQMLLSTHTTPWRDVGSSTFALVTCFRMSATDLRVAASKYSSSARSSFIASAVRHITAKMAMPFVPPA